MQKGQPLSPTHPLVNCQDPSPGNLGITISNSNPGVQRLVLGILSNLSKGYIGSSIQMSPSSKDIASPEGQDNAAKATAYLR